MENLDLDIENYNTKDLERFFRINPKKKYSPADIELKEYEIRNLLLKEDVNINKRLKRSLIDFLDKAKNTLILLKCGGDKSLQPPSIIPKNWKLDTFQENEPPSVPKTNHEIIDRPKTPFVYSNNSDFFPGTINPLNTRIISKCLNIDTRFRDNIYSTQSSDFIVQLPTKYSKVVSMQLTSIEFPISFYGISEYYNNNYIYIDVEHDIFSFDSSGTLYSVLDGSGNPQVVNTSRVFIIPDGNYDPYDLIDVLNKLLSPRTLDNDLISPDDVFSYVLFLLDVSSLISGTGKVTIDIEPYFRDTIHKITVDFTRDKYGNIETVPITSKLGWNLGFIKPIYSGSAKYVAEAIIEPINIRYLFLVLDDYNNNSTNYFESVFKKSLCAPNIIARISLFSKQFNLQTSHDYKYISEPRKYFGPVDIQRLHIRVIDDQGRTVAMNNSNFSFCIELKIVYDL